MRIRAVQLKPTRPWHMAWVNEVLDDLRPEDQYEFAASGSSPQLAGQHIKLLAELGDAWVMVDEGALDVTPVFAWGIAQTTPGIYSLWGFGNKRTRRAMPQITRWGMNWWLPSLRDRLPGIRRIEVRVPVSSVHSINWLRKLGMEIECTLQNYSVHGENFFQLAMTFPKVPVNVHTSSGVLAPEHA